MLIMEASDVGGLFGGSAAKTDRKQQLAGFGDLSNLFNFGMNSGKAETGQSQDLLGQVDFFDADDVPVGNQLALLDEWPDAVGGSGNVNLVGAGEFVGNVYAPLSLVTAPGYLDVYGSIFANDFQIPGYADFNYDSAITQIGSNCPPVMIPGECSQCGECTNGLACVGGKCGACTEDSDCCGQEACTAGPSAMGSVNGIPSSMTSAPQGESLSKMAKLTSMSGSPAVMKGMKAARP